MKVLEFFKAVDGARDLCKDLQEHEVLVRLRSSNGFNISEHFTLTKVSYMFSPLHYDDGTKGAMVLEIRVD